MGDSGGDPPDRWKGAIDQIKEQSPNGAIINGLLVWMDIQNNTTAPTIWKNQMIEAFDDEEIIEAKTVLFSTVGGDGSRIGKFENHPKKKSLHAEDLVVAMKKLWDADEVPLLLGTSTMMRTVRNYNMEKENDVNIADVMNRVKLLEKGIEKALVEQKNEMKSMTEIIGTIGQGPSSGISFQKDGQRGP